MSRLLTICKAEGVRYTNDGLEALLFCCDGDLRMAVNSLQATASGFDVVNGQNVLKVCDQPPPSVAQKIVSSCDSGGIEGGRAGINRLWNDGYSASDIMGTIFKVTKDAPMSETLRLEFLKVREEEAGDG